MSMDVPTTLLRRAAATCSTCFVIGRDKRGEVTVGIGPVELPVSVAYHRVLIIVMAVSLLWATSLSTARYFTAQYVTAPPIERVYFECDRAYNEVQSQRESHVSCVSRQTAQCEARLDREMERETSRSRREAEFNRQLVKEAGVLGQKCSASQLQTLRSLQTLQEAGVILAWDDRACSAAEHDEARAIVGDIGEAKAKALDVATQYAHGAETMQMLALLGLDERAQYDLNYLDTKRQQLSGLPTSLQSVSSERLASMEEAFAALEASFGACTGSGRRRAAAAVEEEEGREEGREGRGLQQSCELPLGAQVEQMRAQYELLQEAYAQQRREMSEYAETVSSAVDALKPPLQSAQALASQLDPGFQLPSLELPDLQLTDVHLGAFPSSDELQAQLVAFQRRQQERSSVYLHRARTDAKDWADQVAGGSEGVGALLEDYHPPPLNTSEQRERMRRSTDVYLAQQERALDAFARLGERRRGDNGTAAGANGTLELPALPKRTNPGFSFEPLVGTEVDVDLLSLAMGQVVWVATAADVAWRCYRSVRIVVRYWSKAALSVPPLDLRQGSAAASASLGAMARLCAVSPAKLIGSLLLSPVTGLMLVVLAVFLVLNAATALYVPAYLHYVAGCVDPPRNGTFFANNVYSVSYNYASGDGNRALLEGLDDFHSRRAANCSAELRDSAREQQRVKRQLDDAVARAADASADQLLLRRCLDVGAMAARQRASVRGAGVADAWDSLELMLQSTACAGSAGLAEQTLRAATYNCSALPECKPSCDGPSRQVVGTLTKRCGCSAEWLLHGMVLQILLAIFVFVCINLWRVFLMEALCKLMWRSLLAGEFEFTATCDEWGVPAVGKKEILKALKEALRWTVTMGWIMLALSMLINVPWIVVLNYVGGHLDVASLQPLGV